MPGTSEETEKLPVQGVHGALSASSIHPSIPPVLPLWVQRASRERDTVRQTPRFGLRLGLGGRHRRSLTLAIAVCRVPREEAADHRQGNPRPRRFPKAGSPQFFSPLGCCRFWGVCRVTGHLRAIVQRVPGLSLLGVYRACSKAMHDLHDLHDDLERKVQQRRRRRS